MYNKDVIYYMNNDTRLSPRLKKALKDAYFLQISSSSAIWNVFTHNDPNESGYSQYNATYLNNIRRNNNDNSIR